MINSEDMMKVLNLYFSSTGNTQKVAMKIEETLKSLGHSVDTVRVTSKDIDVDILRYGFVFAGSGVYGQLPGQSLLTLFRELRHKYAKDGELKLASPRRPAAKAVVYCTYGGAHTGVSEAIPAVKYMGQLFDHLGYAIVGEWYIVGEYKGAGYHEHSIAGRLGDIRGRPHEGDLQDVGEKVKGIVRI
jgi:flavodoxin